MDYLININLINFMIIQILHFLKMQMLRIILYIYNTHFNHFNLFSLHLKMILLLKMHHLILKKLFHSKNKILFLNHLLYQ